MTVFDYVVLVVVGVSALISLMRGLVREVLALVSWIAAAWLSAMFTPQLAMLLPDSIPDGPLRLAAAFIGLFLVLVVLFALVGLALGELIKGLGLSGVDRFLGLFFGFLRGVLIVAVLVLVGGLTELPKQAFWRDAVLAGSFEALVLSVRGYLPVELGKRISYDG